MRFSQSDEIPANGHLNAGADHVRRLQGVECGYAARPQLVRQHGEEAAEATGFDRGLDEAAKPVEEQPLDTTPGDRVQQTVREPVLEVLSLRLPEDLEFAVIDRRVEAEPEARRLVQQPGRRLEEAKEQPGLGRARAIQEVQTKCRLADARGTDQGRNGRLGKPPPSMASSPADTGRQPASPCLVGRDVSRKAASMRG